jgi:hypothetical protein
VVPHAEGIQRSRRSRNQAGVTLWRRGLGRALVVAGVVWPQAGLGAAQTAVPSASVALAPLAGPHYTPPPSQTNIGFYGTDLGFTMKHEGQLRIVFGDSWAAPDIPSIGPLGDDCQGTVCLQSSGCPTGGSALVDGDAVQTFTGFTGLFFNRPGPRLVFRLNAFAAVAPLPVYQGTSTLLDMGPLKTPVAVFSNGMSGAQSGAFGLFGRGEPVPCTTSAACGSGFTCDTNLGIDALGIGCVKDPPFFFFCPPPPGGNGICVDTTSPRFSTSPTSARLRGQVTRMRVGNADPLIHEQYYTRTWSTHKFTNPSATTVNSYVISGSTGATTVADPAPANGPVTGTERVFVWGRPSFVGVGGAQSAKLYFAVVDVPAYSATGSPPWSVSYFAGLNASSAPTFSSNESAAVALDLGGTTNENLHIVNQLSVRFVSQLNKWVMLYGGDMEPALHDGATGGQGALVTRHPQGAIHVRFASKPWGPWSTAQPILNAGNPATTPPVAGSQYAAGGMLHHGGCTPSSQCIPGEPFWDALFARNEPGFLYGANLIPEWTEDRGTFVEIYWNVSTWSPYQVVLMRSRINK